MAFIEKASAYKKNRSSFTARIKPFCDILDGTRGKCFVPAVGNRGAVSFEETHDVDAICATKSQFFSSRRNRP
jgi:hypothetical protein